MQAVPWLLALHQRRWRRGQCNYAPVHPFTLLPQAHHAPLTTVHPCTPMHPMRRYTHTPEASHVPCTSVDCRPVVRVVKAAATHGERCVGCMDVWGAWVFGVQGSAGRVQARCADCLAAPYAPCNPMHLWPSVQGAACDTYCHNPALENGTDAHPLRHEPCYPHQVGSILPTQHVHPFAPCIPCTPYMHPCTVV